MHFPSEEDALEIETRIAVLMQWFGVGINTSVIFLFSMLIRIDVCF